MDLGAGFGRDAIFMARQGFRVVAVEKSSEKIERIKQTPGFDELAIELHCMSAENFDIEPDKYSVINANNVLQFIEKANAIELIERMKSNIISGGYVLISCFTVHDPSYEKFKERCYFDDGELRTYFMDWEIIHYEEGIIDDRGHLGMEMPHQHGIVKILGKKITMPKTMQNIKTENKQFLALRGYTRNCPLWLLQKGQQVCRRPRNMRDIDKIFDCIMTEFDRHQFIVSTTNNFQLSRFITVHEVLNKRLRTCGALATVVASVLRSLGVPVKLINGWYTKDDNNMRHAWNEIYVPSVKRFVPFDITRMNHRFDRFHKRKDEWVDWSDLEKNYKPGE